MAITAVESANGYIDSVLSGSTPACRWTRLACERQRKDLEQGVDGYAFSDAHAERVCKFVQLFSHIKGTLAGRPLLLDPWQLFILTTVFGWVDEDNLRRFKTVYLEVARKNSKSTLLAPIALYCAFGEGEGGAECYTAATTGDQARIVFEVAQAMVRKAFGFRQRFGVEAAAHAIYQEASNSFLKPINAEASTQDGLNVHFVSMDELHAHKKRDLYDVMETATGARSQPIVWNITTAGTNRSGIGYEQRRYLTKVLDGQQDDDEYFGVIYTVDTEDLEDGRRHLLFEDENLWRKANPSYGAAVNPADMMRLARKAREMTSAQNNFLTKRLNVWVNADVAWIDMPSWDACADSGLSLDDFEGKDCVQALDLASKLDIMAQVLVFRRQIDGVDHYYLFGDYYLPEETVENSPNSQYEGWEIEGRLIVSPGPVNDYRLVEDRIIENSKRFNVRATAYDQTQAAQLASRMGEEGIPMEAMAQSVANFSEPMKEIEALTRSRRLHHNGCEIMSWQMSNVVCHTNAKDQVYPRKEAPENKIDGPVALIMAMRRWIDWSEEDVEPNVYQSRGLRTLS